MGILHSMIGMEELTETTLETWYTFVTTLNFRDLGPHAGATSAAIVAGWPAFTPMSKATGRRIINYILLENEADIASYLEEIVSLDGIPELADAHHQLLKLKENWSLRRQLLNLLLRATNENNALSVHSLIELKNFMITRREDFQKFASGDIFDPLVGEAVHSLFKVACRDGSGYEEVRLHAYDCIGVLGALDPDRFDLISEEATMTILYNFEDNKENVNFVLHLIADLLSGTYRAANDITYQNNLAYVLQELLRFCEFTPNVVAAKPTAPVSNQIRQRWELLPPSVVETVAALLEAKLTLSERPSVESKIPVYPSVTSYREWIQRWTQHLISRVKNPNAQLIFGVFRIVVRHQDVVVALHILPHLVLNIIMSGEEKDREDIRTEILTVLEDQVSPKHGLSADRRLLSAQVRFFFFAFSRKISLLTVT